MSFDEVSYKPDKNFEIEMKNFLIDSEINNNQTPIKEIFNTFLPNENIRNLKILKHNKSRSINLNNSRNKKHYDLNEFKKNFKNNKKEINSLFNLKNSIFKEMNKDKPKSLKRFEKGLKKIFFGKNGYITEKIPFLKNIYKPKRIYSSIGINTKIYAGQLDFMDLKNNIKSSYGNRLMENKRAMLSRSANFSIALSNFDKLNAKYMSKITEKTDKNNIKNNGNNNYNNIQKNINMLLNKNENYFSENDINYKNKINNNNINIKKITYNSGNKKKKRLRLKSNNNSILLNNSKEINNSNNINKSTSKENNYNSMNNSKINLLNFSPPYSPHYKTNSFNVSFNKSNNNNNNNINNNNKIYILKTESNKINHNKIFNIMKDDVINNNKKSFNVFDISYNTENPKNKISSYTIKIKKQNKLMKDLRYKKKELKSLLKNYNQSINQNKHELYDMIDKHNDKNKKINKDKEIENLKNNIELIFDIKINDDKNNQKIEEFVEETLKGRKNERKQNAFKELAKEINKNDEEIALKISDNIVKEFYGKNKRKKIYIKKNNKEFKKFKFNMIVKDNIKKNSYIMKKMSYSLDKLKLKYNL